LRRAEGGAKIVGVFRVKNHGFMPKNLIFSNFRGGGVCRVPPLDLPLLYKVYDTSFLIKIQNGLNKRFKRGVFVYEGNSFFNQF
jgi:hypothetical protein